MTVKNKKLGAVLILLFVFISLNSLTLVSLAADDTVITAICPAGADKFYDRHNGFLGCGLPPTKVNKDSSDKVTSIECAYTPARLESISSELRNLSVIAVNDPDNNVFFCKVPEKSEITENDPCSIASVYEPVRDKCNEGDTFITCNDGSKKCVISAGSIATYQASTTIPCKEFAGGTCESPSTPAGLVSRLYQFGLMIGGLLALGALMFGALKYILSAGNIGNQSDAKDWMVNALWGLALLFGAYIILYNINPNLVKLNNPGDFDIINSTTPPTPNNSTPNNPGNFDVNSSNSTTRTTPPSNPNNNSPLTPTP